MQKMASRAACLGRRISPLLLLPHHPNFVAAPRVMTISKPHPPAFKCRISCIHEEATLDPMVSSKKHVQSSENWKIKMLYDGECPLCMREHVYRMGTALTLIFEVLDKDTTWVNMLKERNKRYGTIKFVDISSSKYTPEENEGLDYETVMGRIHAILHDGTVLTDIAAFRRLYEEVGLGWVYRITKYEPIATLANAVYGAWANYRLQITGRPSLETILEARKKNMVIMNNFGNQR